MFIIKAFLSLFLLYSFIIPNILFAATNNSSSNNKILLSIPEGYSGKNIKNSSKNDIYVTIAAYQNDNMYNGLYNDMNYIKIDKLNLKEKDMYNVFNTMKSKLDKKFLIDDGNYMDKADYEKIIHKFSTKKTFGYSFLGYVQKKDGKYWYVASRAVVYVKKQILLLDSFVNIEKEDDMLIKSASQMGISSIEDIIKMILTNNSFIE